MEKSLLEKHINNNLSLRQIAKIENLSYTTIKYWVKKHNLKTIFSNSTNECLKKCFSCEVTMTIENFYKKGKNNLQPYCKTCFNKKSTQRWIDRKIWAIQYKGSKCIDCNLTYPETPYQVFDFHHIEPTHKDMDWSKIRLSSFSRMKSELDKCVLLCANCHRVRHINL